MTAIIAVAVPAHLAALYALLARPDRVAYSVRVETVESKSVVQLPAPPIVVTVPTPIAPTETRACPAPNRKARTADVQMLPAASGMYASPTNADWLVAWSDSTVYFSTNGGASFDKVLEGDGRVHSAAIDCFGDVIAARGKQIGVHSGTKESWHDVPGIELDERTFDGAYAPNTPSPAPEPPDVWIVGGGPDVVVVGFARPYAEWKSRAAISSDHGRSWTYRDLSDGGFEGTHLGARQRPTGEIDIELEIEDCGGEWMETYSIANGEVTKVDGPSAPDGADENAFRAGVIKKEPWRDSAVVTDAAGRRWAVDCGQPTILKKGQTSCEEESAGNE